MVGVEMNAQLMMSYSRDTYVRDAYEHEREIPFLLSRKVHGEGETFNAEEYIVVDEVEDEWMCCMEQLVAEWLVSR